MFWLAGCETVFPLLTDQTYLTLQRFSIPLRLGYVPVVNRGQRDIEQNKAISGALENERQFFENHQSYKGKSQYCGTPFLARKLNMVSGLADFELERTLTL